MRRAIGAIAIAIATTSTPALAQQPGGGTSSENRALAETLFFTGRGMMEAGRYAEAAVKLAESYRLDPTPGTLLNLAVCHQKIGKLASAGGEFRQAIADAKRAGRADREELAAAAVAEIEPELPWLSIEVPADVRVAGLEITRNGLPIAPAAWATELPVDPGQVEIVAHAPGYKPHTQTVSIAKRQHLVVRIERLELAPVVSAPQRGWSSRRTTGFVVGAVGVASIGVGLASGLTAIAKRKDSDGACPVFDGDRRCSQAGVDAMSSARTWSWVSDVAVGVGVISLATGAWLFVTGGRAQEAPRTGAIQWHLDAGPTRSGFEGAIRGTF
jgi:hypothetical protein